MNKQALQDFIQLTQECLARFWQLDAEFVINYFDENIVWIGSAQSQYIEGYDETVKDFREIMNEIKPCHVTKQEFTVVQNTGNTCTIAGRYFTTTDDEVGYFLQVQQRCTFVWEVIKGEPKIKHCHISNPIGELKLAEGEKFVNALGEMSKKYWSYRINSIENKQRIVVTDTNNATHFLLPSDVIYVNAVGRNCIVYTSSGEEFNIRNSITDFMSNAGENFVLVHRSYGVNTAYISCINQFELVMTDGSIIPIPKRRYKEIRQMLMGFYEN